MEIFDEKDKMVSLIRMNYHLLPVINRFGIRLGFKDKTVEQVCEEKKIQPDFFLAIVNTFHNESYFPEKELLSFSPLLILDYLKKTHQYYLSYVLPRIEGLLEKLISGCRDECTQLDLINAFYQKYKKELLLHIDDEEKNAFPYVQNLVEQNRLPETAYNMHVFEKEHSNVDIKLNDLKNLILKYIEPVYDDNICNEFLITLIRFEKDIMDHARIEDKILVPSVKDLEKKLRDGS